MVARMSTHSVRALYIPKFLYCQTMGEYILYIESTCKRYIGKKKRSASPLRPVLRVSELWFKRLKCTPCSLGQKTSHSGATWRDTAVGSRGNNLYIYLVCAYNVIY